ncbi:MAG: hypothetical protein JXA57_18820 [Armatimonadetes bacterium]|nr:hypothetical protein [Armatimonadota bacterium]
MFPSTFFGLFPPFPRDNRAFVAMSFDGKFRRRYDQVIAPALRNVGRNGVRLEPFRVDAKAFSDSILTEILDGVARCRVFVADVTAVGKLKGKPERNANVLYEVGLAHAVRLPEEIVILRSDDFELLFDIANVRVLRYDPDKCPEQARRVVAESVAQSMKEVDLRKHLAVRQVLQSLTYEDWQVLTEAADGPSIPHPTVKTMRDVMQNMQRIPTISKLLDGGLLCAEFAKLNKDLMDKAGNAPASNLLVYRITEFGRAVFNRSLDSMFSTAGTEALTYLEDRLKPEDHPGVAKA